METQELPCPTPGLADDRRASPRYPAAEVQARFGWWAGPVFRECSALILNVSRGGALVAVDEVPPDGVEVWIRLDPPLPTGWVGARVVQSFPTRLGPYKFGMAFLDTCPLDFFEATVFGTTP